MTKIYFFKNIQILEGSKSTLERKAVLIKNGVIKAFGEKALPKAEILGIKPQNANNMLFDIRKVILWSHLRIFFLYNLVTETQHYQYFELRFSIVILSLCSINVAKLQL